MIQGMKLFDQGKIQKIIKRKLESEWRGRGRSGEKKNTLSLQTNGLQNLKTEDKKSNRTPLSK